MQRTYQTYTVDPSDIYVRNSPHPHLLIRCREVKTVIWKSHSPKDYDRVLKAKKRNSSTFIYGFWDKETGTVYHLRIRAN